MLRFIAHRGLPFAEFFSHSGVLADVRVEGLGVDMGRSRSHRPLIKTKN